MSHGKWLITKDKEEKVDAYLLAYPERGNSRIAEVLGTSMQFVDGRRIQLETLSKIPKLDYFIRKNGRKDKRYHGVK